MHHVVVADDVDYLYSNVAHDGMILDVMTVHLVMDRYVVNVKAVNHDAVELAVDIDEMDVEVIEA